MFPNNKYHKWLMTIAVIMVFSIILSLVGSIVLKNVSLIFLLFPVAFVTLIMFWGDLGAYGSFVGGI